MDKLNRRKFLKVAGASTAVVAGVSVPSAGLLAGNTTKSDTLTFRAVAGLPAKPLPSYLVPRLVPRQHTHRLGIMG